MLREGVITFYYISQYYILGAKNVLRDKEEISLYLVIYRFRLVVRILVLLYLFLSHLYLYHGYLCQCKKGEEYEWGKLPINEGTFPSYHTTLRTSLTFRGKTSQKFNYPIPSIIIFLGVRNSHFLFHRRSLWNSPVIKKVCKLLRGNEKKDEHIYLITAVKVVKEGSYRRFKDSERIGKGSWRRDKNWISSSTDNGDSESRYEKKGRKRGESSSKLGWICKVTGLCGDCNGRWSF